MLAISGQRAVRCGLALTVADGINWAEAGSESGSGRTLLLHPPANAHVTLGGQPQRYATRAS